MRENRSLLESTITSGPYLARLFLYLVRFCLTREVYDVKTRAARRERQLEDKEYNTTMRAQVRMSRN
jgi:hypothetical protein